METLLSYLNRVSRKARSPSLNAFVDMVVDILYIYFSALRYL